MPDNYNHINELISVILPTYNREGCILNAINSILQQTHNNLELIIVDDGSIDGTRELVNSLCDDRIRYIYQENGGACKARNTGIDTARGEYIAFQDSDDVSFPKRLEKELKFLVENNADVVFCKMKCTCNGQEQGWLPENVRTGVFSPQQNWGGIGNSAIFGKKSVFCNCKFDEQMPRLQDFELLMRITENYTMYYLDEALVAWNIGNDSISLDAEKGICATELILQKHSDLLVKYPKMAEELRNIAENITREVINDDKQLFRMANVVGRLRSVCQNDHEGWAEEVRYLLKTNEKLKMQINMYENNRFLKVLSKVGRGRHRKD